MMLKSPDDATAASSTDAAASLETIHSETPAEAPADDAAAAPESEGTQSDDTADEGDSDDSNDNSDSSPEPLLPESLEAPEGLTLEGEVYDQFLSVATEQGFTQEVAQQMINLAGEFLKAEAGRNVTAWDKVQEDWLQEIADDPEIGGPKLQAEVTPAIAQIVTHYGGEEATQVLSASGLANNPTVVKMLYAIAKDFQERPPLSGDLPPGGRRTLADIFSQTSA